jgi:hypothetical protein
MCSEAVLTVARLQVDERVDCFKLWVCLGRDEGEGNLGGVHGCVQRVQITRQQCARQRDEWSIAGAPLLPSPADERGQKDARLLRLRPLVHDCRILCQQAGVAVEGDIQPRCTRLQIVQRMGCHGAVAVHGLLGVDGHIELVQVHMRLMEETEEPAAHVGGQLQLACALQHGQQRSCLIRIELGQTRRSAEPRVKLLRAKIQNRANRHMRRGRELSLFAVALATPPAAVIGWTNS